MDARHVRRDFGGLVFGGILLVVGIYYLFQKTLGLNIPDLNWDTIWPVLLVILGGVVLFENWSKRQPG